MNAREVADALKGKKRGKGWQAKCPAHDDKNPSLSIKEKSGDPDGVLLCCHAGCSFDQIVAAIPEFSNSNSGSIKPHGKTIVATHPYKDKDGKVLCETVRYQPKAFKQRRPDGAGDYIWNLEGVDRVLYRLPELIKADSKQYVWLTEGEADADHLAGFGWVATTNIGGAGKWRSEYSEALRGRHVVIIPDNDEPGGLHAEQVAQSLKGIAKSIRIVNLPDLPEKGDVRDYLKTHTAKELVALAKSTPEYAPTFRILKGFNAFTSEPIIDGDPICFEACRGEVVLIPAITNHGKSTLVRNAAISLACGRAFPPFVPDDTPRRVILLNFEGARARFQNDIAIMAQALDEDERLLLNDNLALSHAPEIADIPLSLSNENHFNLVAVDAQAFCPDVIIIDTLTSGFKMKDERDNAEQQARMAQLIHLARRLNCVVLVPHHIGKQKAEEGTAREEAHRARGASALGDMSAAIFNVEFNHSTQITTVTCAKRKSGDGLNYEITLNLNRDARWFESTDPDARPKKVNKIDMVLRVLYDERKNRPVKLYGLEISLVGKCSRKSISNYLKDLLKAGLVSQPVTGRWEINHDRIADIERRLGIVGNSLSTDTQLPGSVEVGKPGIHLNDLPTYPVSDVANNGNGSVAQPKAEGEASASVPFFITKKNRKHLKDIGYSDAKIDAMKPEEAYRVLRDNGLVN